MDDGSGIASLIEIANIAKSENLRPKRSILFVAVTGEEKGLLGSQYFTSAPTVPLKNIVADINMDMYLPLFPLKSLAGHGAGGIDARRRYSRGGGESRRRPCSPIRSRSAIFSSAAISTISSGNGVPALTFKFGYDKGSPEEKLAKDWLRERYHAPSDDLNQPVDKPAAAEYNRIMLDLGMRVADASTRPHWNADSFFKRFEKN